MIINNTCVGFLATLNDKGDYAFHFVLSPTATDEDMRENVVMASAMFYHPLVTMLNLK